MADATPKVEDKKVEETKVEKTEEKPVEKTEEKTEEKKAETKPAATEPAKASSASTEEPSDVNLSEEYKTFEEDEEVLVNIRAKLYRFHLEGKEWKERGTGQARLLKHKQNNRIRFLMRRDKTFKICGNHYILPTMDLQVNKNNDKSWIWNCPADYSEDPQKPSADVYAIRFNSADDTAAFKKAWVAAQEHMKSIVN